MIKLSQNYTSQAYEPVDDRDTQSCEPNFVIVTSCAYLYKERGGDEYSGEFDFKNKVAPTFMVYAKDDTSHVGGGIAYERALKAAGGKTKILLYEKGGHDLKGIKWFPKCQQWLTEIGINIRQPKATQPAAAVSDSADRPKPNIVHILTDDFGWQDPVCFDLDGKTPFETPRCSACETVKTFW